MFYPPGPRGPMGPGEPRLTLVGASASGRLALTELLQGGWQCRLQRPHS